MLRSTDTMTHVCDGDKYSGARHILDLAKSSSWAEDIKVSVWAILANPKIMGLLGDPTILKSRRVLVKAQNVCWTHWN